MRKPSLFLRVAGPTLFMGLLLLGTCSLGAAYLYRILDRTILVLGENVKSRRAARILSDDLEDLILVIEAGDFARVEQFRERVRGSIADAQGLANTREEHRIVETIDARYRFFDLLWEGAVPGAEAGRPPSIEGALHVLTREIRPALRELRVYNGGRVDSSLAEHRQSVRLAAWGVVALGGLGTLAGLLLGYAVARALSRSIHRLSIQIRDAAGRLGHDEAPDIRLEGDLPHLSEQMKTVVSEIGTVLEQLRQREREVLTSERMATFGRIAAVVAHELRNPLTSVTGLIQANREEAEKAGLPADDLRVIEDQLRGMEVRIQSLLDFGRMPEPMPTEVDLADLAGRSLHLIATQARNRGIALEFNPPDEAIRVEADAGQIQQVLINLARNALDAMPQGGHARILLRRTDDGSAELVVQDTGPGIAPEHRERIFDPFVSTKAAGLGLGLTVSRRIAEAHGGTLIANGPAQGGAHFVLRLPMPEPGTGRIPEGGRR